MFVGRCAPFFNESRTHLIKADADLIESTFSEMGFQQITSTGRMGRKPNAAPLPWATTQFPTPESFFCLKSGSWIVCYVYRFIAGVKCYEDLKSYMNNANIVKITSKYVAKWMFHRKVLKFHLLGSHFLQIFKNLESGFITASVSSAKFVHIFLSLVRNYGHIFLHHWLYSFILISKQPIFGI